MLRDKEDLFGHVILDRPDGPVYEDDGSRVDFANPRPCLGCKARCAVGTHDPCIANLPGTYQACCGHGRETAVNSDRPAGYVGLTDGRTIEFSGTAGGERIRAAVDAALEGLPLPEGFNFGQRMWWEGLSEAQRQYVQDRMTSTLARLTMEETGAESLDQAIVTGEKMWFDGLDEEVKNRVMARMAACLAALAQEALSKVQE